MQSSIFKAVRSACLAGSAVAVMFGSAGSYAAASDASADTGAELQEVIVTGSHLRRTDTETPSPVEVITAEEIHQSGYTSAQQVLNDLTANGQGTLSQSFSGAFASGAAGVALRGLNVGATLVLIDGHRSAPYPIGDDGYRSFVDVANLPFDAIERVEVLKDGASAVYGSDAIAGVVNIIFKKSFQGFQLTADGGISSHGDGSQSHFAGIWGMGDLDADGRNFYISAEYRRQNAISFLDRGGEFEQRDYTSTGGINDSYGAQNDLRGPTPSRSATGYVVDPATGQAVGFMPGCNAALFAANKCTYQDSWDQIQPATDNVNLIARFTQKFANDWTGVLEGGYFDSQSEQVNRPDRAIAYQGIAVGPGFGPIVLPAVPNLTIPDTNPSYPAGTGIASGLLHYTFLNIGPTVTLTDAKSYRAVIDVDGKLVGWDLDFSTGYTKVGLSEDGLNYISNTNMQAALNSTTAPFLVGQANTAAVNAFVAPPLHTYDTSDLAFVHVGLSHELFQLPGGPFGLAFGGDYFVRDQFALAPPQVSSGIQATGDFSNNFTVGTQQVASGYAEFDAPIVKQFELNGAIRYDHYNQSGGRGSPKIGFKFTPIPEFAIRGTASRGFRAPGPGENGRAGQTFFAGGFADPILCPNPNNITAAGNFVGQCNNPVAGQQHSNPDLKPETSKAFTLGFIYEPIRDVSATLDLYSIVVNDQIVPGNAAATFVRGTDLSPIAQYQANGTTALVVPPAPPYAYLGIGYVNANSTKIRGFDLGAQFHHKFDYFEFQSKAIWSYTATYDLSFQGVTYHLAGTHGPFFYSGDTGNPRSRVQWSNTLGHGPWSVTGTMNYIDAFNDTDPSAVAFGQADQTTCLNALLNGGGAAGIFYVNQLSNGVIPKAVSCSVPHYITFDLYGHFQLGQHLDIHGSVLNVFNEKAPQDWATYGGALGAVPWNPSMHLQGAIGPFFTLGATYKF